MSGTYYLPTTTGPPREFSLWPASAHPFMVYLAQTGTPYITPGHLRCRATVPETVVELPWSHLAWRAQFPGLVWLAVTTGRDGVPASVSAACGSTLPADSRHRPDRANHDGSTTAGFAGLYHIKVAEFLGGAGGPVRQLLTDDLDWTPPEPQTLATCEDIAIYDTLGRTVTLAIEAGRVTSATVTP